jgi:pimeloyl-ACP methyl ester carboxylesterase
VIEMDLVGHGGSEKPKSGYSMPEQAADVAEALNELGVQGALVVGHSMGGVVATELASQASELVDRVALIDTPADTDEIDHGITQDAALVPVLGEGLWRVRVDPLIKKGYETAFAPGFDTADGFDDPDQVVVDNRAMTYTAFDEDSTETNDYLDDQPLPSRLTTTGVPLLAILGSEDQRVDPDAAAGAYEAVPGAVVKTFDGIGHSPNVEAPADTAETLLRFASDQAPLEGLAKPTPKKSKAQAKSRSKPRVEGRTNRPAKRDRGGG